MSSDPFKLLGVEKGAPWEEIRKAYLRKVRELHPDRGGDLEAYLRLQDSYEILRSRYETYKRAQIVKERPGKGDYFLSFIELTVREVAQGAEKWIKVPDEPEVCGDCRGSGFDPGGRTKVCEFCSGQGLISERESPLYKHPCPRCKGEGRILLDICPRCRGRGEVRGEKEVLIFIPAGVRDGDLLFVPRSPDGPALDVFLEVLIKKEEGFFFEGEDLVARVKVPFWKAVLGGRVTVNTLEGEEEIEVPRGISSGARLILNHRGPFRPDGRRGNLVLEFELWFPGEYPEEALQYFKKFCEIMEEEYGGTSGLKQ